MVGEAALPKLPPVPPPVRLAPFGCEERLILDISQAGGRRLTPMGREMSTKEQVEDVQIHCPLMGSQKGVEQLEGTGEKRAL